MKLFLSHGDTLFTLLSTSPVIEKKAALFKVVIFLALQIPEQLCEHKVFARIMQVAESSDSLEIVEDAVWTIGSLLELGSTENARKTIIKQVKSLPVIPIILKTLKSTKEALVIQSLKTLTQLAPQFRAAIVLDYGEEFYP